MKLVDAEKYISEILLEGCSEIEILQETVILALNYLQSEMKADEFKSIISIVEKYHPPLVLEYKNTSIRPKRN